MANYMTLKAAIQQAIHENHQNEITGQILQSALLSIIDSIGANYNYVGAATPTTNPGLPDQRVFYIASTPGTYQYFSGVKIYQGEIGVLFNFYANEQMSWSVQRISVDAPLSSDSMLNQYVKELTLFNNF